MLEAPSARPCPASLLRDHPRLTVIADRAAAQPADAAPEYASDRVLVVLGHREPGVSAEHRDLLRVPRTAAARRRLAARRPFRAAILTGYTSTGGLSEAEQMKGAWDEHAAPALLEVAGRNTAENASRSLPLVLALGDVRRVVVVTSAWHLRTPWFFAPYRRFGLEVSYRVSFAHGHWPRMLAQELRGARQRASSGRRRSPRCGELRNGFAVNSACAEAGRTGSSTHDPDAGTSRGNEDDAAVEVSLQTSRRSAVARSWRRSWPRSRRTSRRPAAARNGGTPAFGLGRRSRPPEGEPVRLDGGARIAIRPVRPDDAGALSAAYGRLGALTRYHRFLTTDDRLTSHQLAYLTQVDHVAHEALVALDAGTGAIVGVVRYVRDPADPSRARLAVVVVDAWQRRGVGTALLLRLRERARVNGVKTFIGATASTNVAARRLTHRAMSTVIDENTGIVELTTSLEDPAPPSPEQAGTGPADGAPRAGLRGAVTGNTNGTATTRAPVSARSRWT